MTQYSFSGAFNGSTLVVPDAYLNIQPPTQGVIAPAKTGLLGLVGVASWGPVNVATPITPANLGLFGNPVVRANDLVTHANVVLLAQQANGGGTLSVTRVTDGTDIAASVVLNTCASAAIGAGGTGYAVNDTITLANGVVVEVLTVTTGAVATVSVQTAGFYTTPSGPVAQAATSGSGTGATFTLTSTAALTLTSKYTGTLGNQATWAISQGSSYTPTTPSWRLSLQVPGFASEVFDNISGTANALFVAMAAAVNNGNSPIRGPSALMVATAGASTANTVTTNSGTLSAGTDGTASITSAFLVGNDLASARTGVYTFRNSGASHLVVADLSDTTQEAALLAFGQSEGILVHTAGPAGETPATGATAKQTAGTNNRFLKRWLGDWCYYNDNYNGTQRLLAPSTFGAAMQSTLQPQQSALNKSVYGVVTTQRIKSSNPYGNDELATLTQNGIDVITNPCPGGSYFGVRIGKTSSSDNTSNTDNWPVLTNFLARSMAGPGGIGTIIGQDITPDFFTEGYDLLDAFLSNLLDNKLIQGYQINFSQANNPQSQTGTGLVVAQVWVQYFGIASIFLVNMQTGATVVIPNSNTTNATGAAA